MMSAETWFAFCLYVFTTSITPGPNNTMMLASGVNFGLSKSIPHMLGITAGFCLMVLLMGLGLGAVFTEVPQLYSLLRWLGAAYMLYLAWKIFNSKPIADNSSNSSNASTDRPMRFLGAAAFQWINPKAWVIALGAVTTYLPAQHSFWQLLVLVLVLGLINFPSTGSWALFGSSMRRFLQNPKFLRLFNAVAAFALVLSLYPLLKS